MNIGIFKPGDPLVIAHEMLVTLHDIGQCRIRGYSQNVKCHISKNKVMMSDDKSLPTYELTNAYSVPELECEDK